MRQSIDKVLLTLALALGAISISTIYVTNKSLAINQLAFWLFGLAALLFSSQFYHKSWQKFSVSLFFVSMLALLLVFMLADPVRGSVRWIDLGIFRFQPSEIVKVAVILTLATFFSNKSAAAISNALLSFLIILPPFVLIFIEPDIGSAMAIIAIWLATTFAAGMKKEHIISAILLFVLASVVAYEVLAPYQKERLTNFLNPTNDPLGSGYNIIQSKIAVGSGQLFGRGLGRGPQSQLNFLPENESDFIFASIAEQLGALGAGLTIVLFVAMLLRMFSYIYESNRFGQLVISGTLGLFIYQFSTNVGMNMGIVPVTGITLPLVSYGGSSLITTLLLIGIVLSQRTPKY